MKRHRCLKETSHRRTYNLVRKNFYAVCPRCKWHPTFWRSCIDNPYIHMYVEESTSQVKNPANWKLVSKNRKQWMKKPFIKVKRSSWNGFATYYGW
jgi:hypothetical protein